MPAYVVIETDVTDPERYEQYKAAGSLSVAAAGGRYSSAAASWSSSRATGSHPAWWCSSLRT
jgi:uncharacterized protein (DUF1330 family)